MILAASFRSLLVQHSFHHQHHYYQQPHHYSHHLHHQRFHANIFVKRLSTNLVSSFSTLSSSPHSLSSDLSKPVANTSTNTLPNRSSNTISDHCPSHILQRRHSTLACKTSLLARGFLNRFRSNHPPHISTGDLFGKKENIFSPSSGINLHFRDQKRSPFCFATLPAVEKSSSDKDLQNQEEEGGEMNTSMIEEFRTSGVLIKDPVGLERKKKAIKEGGPEKLQVIADFDMTLTSFLVNGRRGQSCHSLVVTENEDVNEDRRKLHAKYYPLEIDATISHKQKLQYMEEWWAESHRLIIKGGLTFQTIQRSVANANIGFRNGTAEIFELLEKHDVPVLIFSAGLADIIEEVLRQKLKRNFPNVQVVSNRMDFDDTGRLVGFKGRVIHVLNKNEHALEMNSTLPKNGTIEGVNMDSVEAEKVLHRTNVVLLGDHLGDLRMSEGVDCENRITVGFLNDNVEQQLEDYVEKFDIVLLNDASMDKVMRLLKDLL